MCVRVCMCACVCACVRVYVYVLALLVQAQVFLLAMLLIAVVSFFIGTIIGPKSDTESLKGFSAYSCELRSGYGMAFPQTFLVRRQLRNLWKYTKSFWKLFFFYMLHGSLFCYLYLCVVLVFFFTVFFPRVCIRLGLASSLTK